jgi:hypothetical protein
VGGVGVFASVGVVGVLSTETVTKVEYFLYKAGVAASVGVVGVLSTEIVTKVSAFLLQSGSHCQCVGFVGVLSTEMVTKLRISITKQESLPLQEF